MSKEVNIEKIKSALIEKLRNSGWVGALKGFLLSYDFDDLIIKLATRVSMGKRFTPPLKIAFRAFEESSYDETKVVIIGQDPYPQLGVADGLAFSCSLTNVAQPSLRYISEAICRTVYGIELEYEFSGPNLEKWANQGVLLLNYTFTTDIGASGTHYDIWKPFISYVIDTINTKKDKVVFVFLGKKAQELIPLVDINKHAVLKASHPASAAYTGSEQWDCNDIFNDINKLLVINSSRVIIW